MNKWFKRCRFLLGASVVLVGCGTGTQQTTPQSETKTVGILQYIEHNALDAANKGFVEELKVLGFEDGKNITIQQKNASGDQANLQTLAEKMAGESDVILAIATPAAQAVAAQTKTVPILFTAVTDPVSAELVNSMEKPGGNVTGTSDQTSVEKQVALLKKALPQAKRIGILYTTNERNSEIQLQVAKKALEEAGYQVNVKGITSSNDVQDTTHAILAQSDAVYITTDNLITNAISLVIGASLEKKVPVFGGSEADVAGGSLFSYGTNYEKLGRQTAHLAAKILNGEKPENIPAEYPTGLDVLINEETAKAFNLDLSHLKE